MASRKLSHFNRRCLECVLCPHLFFLHVLISPQRGEQSQGLECEVFKEKWIPSSARTKGLAFGSFL